MTNLGIYDHFDQAPGQQYDVVTGVSLPDEDPALREERSGAESQ
jgi:hypothetical protein